MRKFNILPLRCYRTAVSNFLPIFSITLTYESREHIICVRFAALLFLKNIIPVVFAACDGFYSFLKTLFL